MKRAFEEAVYVDGVRWLVHGEYTLPAPVMFDDPGQDAVVEDYTITLDAVWQDEEADLTDLLGDEVHRRIIAAVEQKLQKAHTMMLV